MKPENRALLVAVLAFVVATAVVGAYLLVTPSTPSTLIVLSGTVFYVPSTDAGFSFNVTPPGGTLVGAWSSTGKTCVMVPPSGWSIPYAIWENCIAQGVSSGTFNTNLTSPWPAETYGLVFDSDSPVTVRVTQTIQIVY